MVRYSLNPCTATLDCYMPDDDTTYVVGCELEYGHPQTEHVRYFRNHVSIQWPQTTTRTELD